MFLKYNFNWYDIMCPVEPQINVNGHPKYIGLRYFYKFLYGKSKKKKKKELF